MRGQAERWEVIDLRLDWPLQPEITLTQAAGAYFVLWWKEIPLGDLRISAQEFPLSEADFAQRIARAVAPAVGFYLCNDGFKPPYPGLPEDSGGRRNPDLETLTTLHQPLEKLTARAGLQPRNNLSISVVVCTRDRPERLKRCLDALRQLDPGPGEIIVIDNAPEHPSTRHVVEDFGGIIYFPEPVPGLSRARNRGIARSSGEIVAFTDDDAKVHPHWLRGIREAFDRPVVFGVTGLVLAAELETMPQTQFEFEYGGFNCGYRPVLFDSFFFRKMLNRGVPAWRIGAGANMAFRRQTFDRIGFFDQRLGVGAAGCSEDSEFWYRMLAAGMSIAYEPRAVVRHFHRVEPRALQMQMNHYMRGHAAALLVQFEKHQHAGNLRRLVFTLPNYYLHRMKRVTGTSALALLRAEAAGYASGFFAYLQLSLSDNLPVERNRSSRSVRWPVKTQKYKRPLSDFLRNNPYPRPFTEGLFFREKMRAIHRIAPDAPLRRILEVGGGRSGLTSLLYPTAEIVNIDLNDEYASAPCNQRPGVHFMCGNATNLPFENESFDAVTMFDLLEHVPEDRRAVQEAFRVLRPKGFLLVSTPNENWKYPYYRFMKKWCPSEEKLFAEWGHVRRGYSRTEVETLVGRPAMQVSSFINPLTVIGHDVGFSHLAGRYKRILWALLSPLTAAGYFIHRSWTKGTEAAYGWTKSQFAR